MSPALLDLAAREVLQRFSIRLQPASIHALGNGGGFSGANLWRVESDSGSLCVRAWPTGGITVDRLASLHSLMELARRERLTFVPALHTADNRATWVPHYSRLWEATSWQPGHADYRVGPSPAKLRSACAALALLHAAWERPASVHAPCPAVHRRLARCREWSNLVASGWRIPLERQPDNLLRPLAERAWELMRCWVHRVPALLESWAARSFPLQACLCDVWHDHLLFTGASLTGLIDYGAVKVDHVAVDLARLLGSLVGDDQEAWSTGLTAYRAVRPFSAEDEALAYALDQTGTILGAANWLVWLYRDAREFEDIAGVALRLSALVERMETWP